jgi:hypothetical protein
MTKLSMLLSIPTALPVIQIALDQWADGSYVVIDASQLR